MSPSGRWSLRMHPDGRLLLVKGTNAFAARPYEVVLLLPPEPPGDRGTTGPPGASLVFTEDGDVVVRSDEGTSVGNGTGTAGSDAQRLVVQDDGNVVLYDGGTGVVRDLATAAPSSLRAGGSLLPGERLSTDDGRTSLVMQPDGNLVLYAGGVARWASGTGVAGSALAVQDDGNAVVYTPAGQPLFSTGSSGPVLLLVEGGQVTAVTPEGTALRSQFASTWGTPVVESGAVLRQGDRRTAPGGVVTVLQRDGNLVTYRAGRPLFATRTSGADVAVVQLDGNVVLYDDLGARSGARLGGTTVPRGASTAGPSLVPVFDTRTGGNPGSRLVTQADGNLVVYTPADRPVFSAR